MTLLKSARQAIEALEQLQGGCTDSDDGTVEAITVWCPEVIDALRQAIREEENRLMSDRIRPKGKSRVALELLTLRQAIEQAEHVHAVNTSQEHVDETAKGEQEPVAWMYVNKDGECEQIEHGPVPNDPEVTPLYTAPPKKEWVGLTEAERVDIIDIEIPAPNDDHWALAQSIEAALKEKNT